MFEDIGTLTELPLGRSGVDLDVERRGEPGLIGRLAADSVTRVMFVRGTRVAVARHEGERSTGELLCADDPAAPRPDARAPLGPVDLMLVCALAVRDVLEAAPLAMYLGCDRSGASEVPYVAIDLSDVPDSGFGGLGPTDLDWVELRSFAPCASPRDAGLAASAVALSTWHASQRFCPACGAPVRPALSGWAQTCTNPDDAERLLFPRIEPAVITAIVDERDRILLQHNTAWRPRFFSVSAGFVEAGESLEHAVRREAAEEVGIPLGEVRYLGSQPWPFPASIMLGFRAQALSTDVRVDHEEVGSARWFTRGELVAAVESGEIEPPGRASIARHMIEQWLGSSLG